MAQESVESLNLSGSDGLLKKSVDEDYSLEEQLKDLLAWLLNVKTALLRKRVISANPGLDQKIHVIQHEMIPAAKNANSMKKEHLLTYRDQSIQQIKSFIYSYHLDLPSSPPKRNNEDTHEIAPPIQVTPAPPLIIKKGYDATNACIARLAVGQTLSLLVVIKCIFICVALGGIHPAVGAVAALALASFILNSVLREKLSDNEEEEPEDTHASSPLRPRFAR